MRKRGVVVLARLLPRLSNELVDLFSYLVGPVERRRHGEGQKARNGLQKFVGKFVYVWFDVKCERSKVEMEALLRRKSILHFKPAHSIRHEGYQ